MCVCASPAFTNRWNSDGFRHSDEKPSLRANGEVNSVNTLGGVS